MAKGISIGIASDTKDFAQGVKSGVIEPLDDAADAIKDLAKGGDKAGRELEDGFKGAQKATDKYEKALQDAIDTTKKVATTSKQATREVSDDFEISAAQQKKLRKVAINEIGNEAKANAAETFSSFDGSAQSFVDGIQGTLGGLVSSLGPVGLAVGAAGALAIGLINGALQNADTTSQEFKQSVADMTTELIKSGKVGSVSVSYIVEELQKLATESDSSKVSLSKLSDSARKSGTSFEDLAQAYAGNTKGLKDQVKAGKEKLRQDQLNSEALSNLTVEQALAETGDRTAYASALKKVSGQKEVNDYLDQAAAKASEAAKQQDLYAKSGGPELEVKAALIGQINSAYDDAAGAVEDFTNKESGIFDTGAYIAAMDAREKALHDYQNTLASSGLTTEAKSFLNSQGEEAAATFLAGYKAATPAQQKELNRIWSEGGKANSGEYTKALQAGIPKTMDGTKVKVSADTSEVDAQLKRLAQQHVKVTIEGVTRNGVKVF